MNPGSEEPFPDCRTGDSPVAAVWQPTSRPNPSFVTVTVTDGQDKVAATEAVDIKGAPWAEEPAW